MSYTPFRHAGSVILKRKPIQLTFFLTRRCNARCAFCFYISDKNLSKESRPELTLDEIRKISMSTGKLLWLAFSGGEIFLRDDIVEITEVFYERNRPAIILFPTNGRLTDVIREKIEAVLKHCKNRTIHVKLSIAVFEAMHDSVLEAAITALENTGMEFDESFIRAEMKRAMASSESPLMRSARMENDVLRKALGAPKAGHKYFKRTPKAGGGYTYYYTKQDWEKKHPGGEKTSHSNLMNKQNYNLAFNSLQSNSTITSRVTDRTIGTILQGEYKKDPGASANTLAGRAFLKLKQMFKRGGMQVKMELSDSDKAAEEKGEPSGKEKGKGGGKGEASSASSRKKRQEQISVRDTGAKMDSFYNRLKALDEKTDKPGHGVYSAKDIIKEEGKVFRAYDAHRMLFGGESKVLREKWDRMSSLFHKLTRKLS